MNIKTREAVDRCLLNALVSFVTTHSNPDVQLFRQSMLNLGSKWNAVEPAQSPTIDIFKKALNLANRNTREFMELFVGHCSTLRWEQSYTQEDRAVGNDMLSNYGFAEIIGKQGPFVSTRVRAGIAFYGPHLFYPPHRHQAEEIYAVLAGNATCQIEGNEPAIRAPGDILYHAPQERHSLRTGENPLVIAYFWQGGDMREKPSFE